MEGPRCSCDGNSCLNGWRNRASHVASTTSCEGEPTYNHRLNRGYHCEPTGPTIGGWASIRIYNRYASDPDIAWIYPKFMRLYSNANVQCLQQRVSPSFVECDVCAMFGLSCCVMFCRVPLCSIVYCLCLPLPLLGRPVGTYRDRGYHVH